MRVPSARKELSDIGGAHGCVCGTESTLIDSAQRPRSHKTQKQAPHQTNKVEGDPAALPTAHTCSNLLVLPPVAGLRIDRVKGLRDCFFNLEASDGLF